MSSEVKLAVNLGGLEMKNPVTCASGTFGIGQEYGDFVDLESLGAITSKGVSAVAWKGNPYPRIAETPSGLLNTIGLQNPGVEAFCSQKLPWLSRFTTPLIVNVAGHSIDEYVAVIERLEREPRVAAYEVNISCPNVDAGGLALGTDPVLAAQVTRACRECTARPLIVKLTPNVTDVAAIACAVEEAGADAVSLINTLKGMSIDAHRRRPRTSRPVAGLSGPAIKPVALAMVWQVHQAVSLPILGMGGIRTGTDAVEFMLAGATAVAVGAANFADPLASIHVLEGLTRYLEEQEISSARELIGALEV